MNDKNKQVKEIYKLPDGEIVVPFEGADNLQPQDNPYKINPYNGEKIWVKSLRYHPRVILTGSLRVDNDIIYVPLSSREWADGCLLYTSPSPRD